MKSSRPPQSLFAWTLGVVLTLVVWPVMAQPAGEAAPPTSTAPAVATGEVKLPENPLRSPREMMAYFRAAWRAGETENALRCLNFSQVDEEVRRAQGNEYLQHVAEILDVLRTEGHFDPNALPADPTAPPQTIGKDPLLLVLERYERKIQVAVPANPTVTEGETQPPANGEEGVAKPAEAEQTVTIQVWQFASTTVKALPQMHSQLDKLVGLIDKPKPAVVTPPPDQKAAPVNRLRSPYHAVEFFLERHAEAQRDADAYKAAMTAMDFSLTLTDWRKSGAKGSSEDLLASKGPEYVDRLATVLLAQVDEAGAGLDQLSKSPDPNVTSETIGSDERLVIVARQADGKWRFAASTVQRIPTMYASLSKPTADGQAAPTSAQEPLREDTSSPRATLNLFLTSMNNGDLDTAKLCLDLSRLTDAERDVADVLCGKLWLIINRHKIIQLYTVSNREVGPPYSVLTHTAGRIDIARVHTGERAGEWLFTHRTVNNIDELYEAFEDKPLLKELASRRISFWALPSLYVREYIVPDSLKRPLWGLQVWQWIGLTSLLVLGLLFRTLASLLLPRIGNWLLRSEQAAILPQVWRRALLPSANLVMVAAWWIGLQMLDLGAITMSWTWWTLRIVMTLVAVIAAYRIIDVIMSYFQVRAARTASRLDDVLVPLLQKTLKVVVAAIGLVAIADAFGYPVSPLLAGLGIGGLAFGLAAQDTLKNFFGSVNVVLDRPFQVGDWVRIGEVEGTVETVGLRSSRIRTFYNSEFIVPNGEIMTARIDNMGRRKWRRIKTTISVTYDTKPETLEAFTEGIRELIRTHPYTRKDYYHCYFNDFGPASLDILLYCFLEVPEWGTELRERQRLFIDIMRLAHKLGIEFAFPTQTLYMRQDQAAPQRSAHVPHPIDSAHELGRKEARGIVAEFTPGDEKPPPVEY